MAIRCVIYTRKSSEEGLEQDFNSLDSQRNACEAFIASQKGLGWRPARGSYDDGGYSGGSLDRPALQRLLDSIRAGLIDVVVVYKIDRLTRSLTDFAKIMDVFDAGSVSFVSVTQSFNTTSSMGRLTLNMLLSFAQFEREITGERIRDKIAASKKKGMWMGGNPPLGYRPHKRTLAIVPDEAERVRQLFALYVELQSVEAVRRRALELGIGPRVGKRTNRSGGFSCGAMRLLLGNPVYVGKIRHGALIHDGLHAPIIEQALFDEAQSILAGRRNASVLPGAADGMHLLSGLLFDEAGVPLCPTHATKNGRRYRYYVSRSLLKDSKVSKSDATPAEQTWRIPTAQIEPLVVSMVRELLRDEVLILDQANEAGLEPTNHATRMQRAAALLVDLSSADPVNAGNAIRQLIKRITLKADRIDIVVDLSPILGDAGKLADHAGNTMLYELERAFSLKRRGVEMRMIVGGSALHQPVPEPGIADLVRKAHRLLANLTDGSGITIAELANREQMDVSDLGRILKLAFLSPDITKAILTGTQPADLTARRLLRMKDDASIWEEQGRLLGFSAG